MKNFVDRFPDWLRKRFTDGQRFLILCIAAGVLCGLAAVAFHLSIHYTFDMVWEWARHQGKWFWFVMPLAPAVGGLIVGIILAKLAPNAAGSGIPQTKAAFYNDFGVIKFREGVYRFVLGTIFIGFGNCLGREGPTVHMCAAIASKLGQLFGLAKARIQAMVPIGMGAGIAAAFNAPLSAITFVFEELLDDFSTKALGGLVVAVVIAAAISRIILGEDPVLTIHIGDDITTAPWMLVSIPLGLASAFIGHVFVVILLRARAKSKAFKGVPVWLKPAAGGLAVGVIATIAFALTSLLGEAQNGVFSIGYNSLLVAFEGQLVLGVLLILFVFKFAATLISYSTGGSGGLFSPTLFLGGMLGGIFGVAMVWTHENFGGFILEEPNQVVGGCVLLGMGALFASIVRCPFTSLLIIFEMTRNYSLILPLMAGNMISYFVSAQLLKVPLYNSLLLQDGINLRKLPAYQGLQDYRNLPVSTIMTYDVITVDGTLSSAAVLERIIDGKQHHGYPVTDAEGALYGMVMHHELEEFREAGNEDSLITILAHQKVISTNPDMSIRAAANLLIREDVLQIPVVSPKDEKKLLGILTLHDIARQQNAANEQMGR
ncbi:chloride channel protein [Rubellicoccus peritrichatus]|uniref:Chloride channel protein n=1 Tax=Rubellicoccus peritrichatus TaxID=3080537 RepID=A0AAQ3L9T4_9BACT|nr:chloride channel protein [Puniceicoccus sp. CR14]WOO39508.1 chloride channel protein [Puniceicoccus sp. CR14]